MCRQLQYAKSEDTVPHTPCSPSPVAPSVSPVSGVVCSSSPQLWPCFGTYPYCTEKRYNEYYLVHVDTMQGRI